MQKAGLRKQLKLLCDSADAVEKITALRSGHLQPPKERLIREMANVERGEVRWYVAQMVPCLRLSSDECEIAFSILLGYLDDESGIFKTFSTQALAELPEGTASLRARLVAVLGDPSKAGAHAMRTRSEAARQGERGRPVRTGL